MKRFLALALIVAFTLPTVPDGRRSVHAQSLGVISGSAQGPDGSIEGAPVELLDPAGNVVARTTTNGAGAFNFLGLLAGHYVVQMMGINGATVATSIVALTPEVMSETVALTASAADIAAAGGVGGEESRRRRRAAAWILGAASAAAGTVGVGIISTKDDASPSR
jgi:hypothetical protein